MFWIDADFKKSYRGTMIAPFDDEHSYVEIVKELPIWMILAVDKESGSRATAIRRFLFGNIPLALEFALFDRWRGSALYQLQPGEPTIIRVKEVWEAGYTTVTETSFEVILETQVMYLSANGWTVSKAPRRGRLWPPIDPEPILK